MSTLEPTLSEQPFLKGLEKKHLERLEGCASSARFEAGEFIAHHGEEASHLYIIYQGRVALEVFSPGRGPITVQSLGEGDVMGWSWLVPPYLWHFDAQAVELTQAIALDGKCLRKKCDEDHSFGYELLSRLIPVLVKRIEATQLQLIDVYGARTE